MKFLSCTCLELCPPQAYFESGFAPGEGASDEEVMGWRDFFWDGGMSMTGDNGEYVNFGQSPYVTTEERLLEKLSDFRPYINGEVSDPS